MSRGNSTRRRTNRNHSISLVPKSVPQNATQNYLKYLSFISSIESHLNSSEKNAVELSKRVGTISDKLRGNR